MRSLRHLDESDPRLKEMFSGYILEWKESIMKTILKRNEDYTIYRDKSSQSTKRCRVFENVGKIYGRLMVYHAVSLCEYYEKVRSLANRFLIYLRMYQEWLSEVC